MKLRTLISEYLEEKGETESKRRRAYTLGVSGIREFSYDLTAIVEVQELVIGDADTAPLPCNYINVSRIGLCGADGQLRAFAANNNICLNPIFNSCGQQVAPSINNLQVGNNNINVISNGYLAWGGGVDQNSYIANHYRNGECTGAFFGRGGGEMGMYKIDTKRNQIQFIARPVNTATVVIEFLADIQSVDNDFEVHPFMILALKRWIDWNWLASGDKGGLTEAAYRRYVLAYQKMRRRFNSETSFDWLNAMRVANTASVRW